MIYVGGINQVKNSVLTGEINDKTEDTRTPRNDTNPSCEWQLPENADNGFEEA